MDTFPKKWYESKTVWINVFSILLELANVFLEFNVLPTGVMLVIVNVLNIFVRFFTKAEIIK